MDKDMNLTMNQSVNLIDRKTITLSGIKKIISFDNEEFLMMSTMGNINLKGVGLEIIRLDTNEGNVSIKGRINSLNYLEDKKSNKDESVLSKLFK